MIIENNKNFLYNTLEIFVDFLTNSLNYSLNYSLLHIFKITLRE